MSTALLIIDVQQALCHGEYAGFESDRVIDRINHVSRRVRAAGGLVVVIQHDSASGLLQHGSPGWQLADGVVTDASDVFLRKTATDSFHRTALHDLLQERGVKQLIVCGLQSEFCVDTTTRRALALGYPVILVEDGHTTMDNGILNAAQIAAHHNKTLTGISSFGVRAIAMPADAIPVG